MKYAALLTFLCSVTINAEVLKLTSTPVPDDQTSASRLRIELDLQNASSKNIDVLSAICRLPGWYNAAPRQDITLIEFYGDLNGGDSERQVVDEAPLSALHSIAPIWHDVPLIIHKKVPAQITIRYRYTGDINEQLPITQTIDLPARAPLWHVLVGGLSGTMILFVILYFTAQQPKQPVHAFLAAVFAVAIAIIATTYASDYIAPLPVKVDLRDYMGGFVVGLLGVWLTPKVIDALKAVANKIGKGNAPVASPNEDSREKPATGESNANG
jgi:hypothetical protein